MYIAIVTDRLLTSTYCIYIELFLKKIEIVIFNIHITFYKFEKYFNYNLINSPSLLSIQENK